MEFKNLPKEIKQKIMLIGNEYDIIRNYAIFGKDIMDEYFLNTVWKIYPRLVLENMNDDDKKLFLTSEIARKFVKYGLNIICDLVILEEEITNEEVVQFRQIFHEGFLIYTRKSLRLNSYPK